MSPTRLVTIFSFFISGIEPEPCDEATDLLIETSSQQPQLVLEDNPACSVGEPPKEIEKPVEPQKTVDESSSVPTVQPDQGESKKKFFL